MSWSFPKAAGSLFRAPCPMLVCAAMQFDCLRCFPTLAFWPSVFATANLRRDSRLFALQVAQNSLLNSPADFATLAPEMTVRCVAAKDVLPAHGTTSILTRVQARHLPLVVRAFWACIAGPWAAGSAPDGWVVDQARVALAVAGSPRRVRSWSTAGVATGSSTLWAHHFFNKPRPISRRPER